MGEEDEDDGEEDEDYGDEDDENGTQANDSFYNEYVEAACI